MKAIRWVLEVTDTGGVSLLKAKINPHEAKKINDGR